MGGNIKESNIRAGLTMPKEVKQDIEELAKKQNRSFSNLVVTVLMEYIEQQKEQ